MSERKHPGQPQCEMCLSHQERWKKRWELNFPDLLHMVVWLKLNNSDRGEESWLSKGRVFKSSSCSRRTQNRREARIGSLSSWMKRCYKPAWWRRRTDEASSWSEPYNLWEGQKKKQPPESAVKPQKKKEKKECKPRRGIPKVDVNHQAWVESSRLHRYDLMLQESESEAAFDANHYHCQLILWPLPPPALSTSCHRDHGAQRWLDKQQWAIRGDRQSSTAIKSSCRPTTQNISTTYAKLLCKIPQIINS